MLIGVWVSRFFVFLLGGCSEGTGAGPSLVARLLAVGAHGVWGGVALGTFAVPGFRMSCIATRAAKAGGGGGGTMSLPVSILAATVAEGEGLGILRLLDGEVVGGWKGLSWVGLIWLGLSWVGLSWVVSRGRQFALDHVPPAPAFLEEEGGVADFLDVGAEGKSGDNHTARGGHLEVR